MKWLLSGAALLVLSLAGLAWWFFIAGSDAAPTAPSLFPVEEWRATLAEDDAELRPTEIRLIEVGSDVAPMFAAQAGRFGESWKTSYGGFQILTPEGAIFVDSGIDADTSKIMARSPETSVFNQAEYEALLAGMEQAQHILLTHEHLDHVMAVARHPRAERIAQQLRLNQPQKSVLGGFSKSGVLSDELQAVPPFFDGTVTKLAPGVLIVPSPGHTKGSQVIFVTLQNGDEFLFIGDIVWAISSISDLKIRPRFTQVLIFNPNEDRGTLKLQVRALHDLSKTEPDLILLPAHDRDYLFSLIEAGAIGLGIKP